MKMTILDELKRMLNTPEDSDIESIADFLYCIFEFNGADYSDILKKLNEPWY